MKKNILSIVALVAAMFVASPAMAQLAYGIKAGLNMTTVDLKGSATIAGISESISKNADNATGFFVGATAEFTIPLIGIGVDGSVLYDQKKISVDDAPSKTLSYISVPVNVKYSLGLGNLANVFVATGPQFSFNVGDKGWKVADDVEAMQLNDTEFSWNIGCGATLASHYRIGYNYNIGLGKTGDMKADVPGVMHVSAELKKNNTHQISFTYLF